MFMDAEMLIEEPLRTAAGQRRYRRASGAADWRLRQADFAAMLASEAALANANTPTDGSGTHLLVGTNSFVYSARSSRGSTTRPCSPIAPATSSAGITRRIP